MKFIKKHWHLLTVLAASCALTWGCDKGYEEFYFIGHPVGAEMCSATTFGYLLTIDYPQGLGDTITAYGEHYSNAVMAYRSPRLLSEGETIYGVAYQRRDFAALNCVGLFNYTVPEIVLLSVDEEPFNPEDLEGKAVRTTTKKIRK